MADAPDVHDAQLAAAELVTARMAARPPGSDDPPAPETDRELRTLFVPVFEGIATEWGLDERAQLLVAALVEQAGWFAYSAGLAICAATDRPTTEAPDFARQVVQACAQGAAAKKIGLEPPQEGER